MMKALSVQRSRPGKASTAILGASGTTVPLGRRFLRSFRPVMEPVSNEYYEPQCAHQEKAECGGCHVVCPFSR